MHKWMTGVVGCIVTVAMCAWAGTALADEAKKAQTDTKVKQVKKAAKTAAKATKNAKSVKKAIAKKMPAKKSSKMKKTHKDSKGGIQEGIQSLAVRLVTGLDGAADVGFRRMAVLPFRSQDPDAKKHRLGENFFRVTFESISAKS